MLAKSERKQCAQKQWQQQRLEQMDVDAEATDALRQNADHVRQEADHVQALLKGRVRQLTDKVDRQDV